MRTSTPSSTALRRALMELSGFSLRKVGFCVTVSYVRASAPGRYRNSPSGSIGHSYDWTPPNTRLPPRPRRSPRWEGARSGIDRRQLGIVAQASLGVTQGSLAQATTSGRRIGAAALICVQGLSGAGSSPPSDRHLLPPFLPPLPRLEPRPLERLLLEDSEAADGE